MAEVKSPLKDKVVMAAWKNGQWVVKIDTDYYPITMREFNLLQRAVKVAMKHHLKAFNLKQRAQQRAEIIKTVQLTGPEGTSK